jgi:hypothetical protein
MPRFSLSTEKKQSREEEDARETKIKFLKRLKDSRVCGNVNMNYKVRNVGCDKNISSFIFEAVE